SYAKSGLWVANAPRNTEALGLTWRKSNWDVGMFDKRIGQMYNDNGSTNQAVLIDPFNITNLYINYTIKNESYLRGTQIRLTFNNLFDQHNIIGVTPATTASSLPAAGDTLMLLPGRSISLTVTGGYSPKR